MENQLIIQHIIQKVMIKWLQILQRNIKKLEHGNHMKIINMHWLIRNQMKSINLVHMYIKHVVMN